MALAMMVFSVTASAQCDSLTLNLYDSWGDGWNGNSLTVDGVDYTVTAGATASFTVCLDLTICNDIVYNPTGSYQSENSWDVTDASGAVLASGGAASGNVGACAVYGCTDSTALNYDAAADTDDGSCCYDNLVAITTDIDYFGTSYPWSCNGMSWSLNLQGDSNVVATGVATDGCTDLGGGATLCLPDGCYEFNAADASGFGTYAIYSIDGVAGAGIPAVVTFAVGAGVCQVYGCTDPNAANYDSTATVDDGSCITCTDNLVQVTVDGGSWQSEVGWTLLASDGSVIASGGAPYSAELCLVDDCYTVSMTDAYGDGWNGNTFSMEVGGVGIGQVTLLSGAAGSDDISLNVACPVYGCMDATACNYDANADTDDGSCEFTSCAGCTDPAAVNYDPTATIDDNSCAYACTAAPYLENFDLGVGTWTNNGWVNDQYGTPSGSTGPTDDITGGGFYMYYETSSGYSPTVDMTSECLDISALANPALSFYTHMYGSTIGTLNVYVNGDTVWTKSGDQGNQWDWNQVDLSAYAGVDVTITFEAFYGGSYTGDIALDNIGVDEFVVISGCTDPIATNYDASANTDDGSCTYCQGTMLSLNMYDSFGDGWNGATFTATGANTGTVFGPFTVASGSYALEMLCMDDDCYEITVGGGTWDSEITWDITNDTGAVLASGAAPYYNQGALSVGVTCPTYGCTDTTALNYDTAATADDGSCAYLCDPYVASASVVSAPSCNGAFDASVEATIDGSFGNDFWLWDDGQTTSTATGLAAGTYSCTITDSVNGCSSTVSVTVDPTPVISIVGTTFDATPGNSNGGVDLAVSGGTPCYNGAALSLAGTANTTTQWASNVFDVVATSDLQITSIDQPSMAGVGTADVYYRLGSAAGFEADASGWMLAGSAPMLANVTGETSNIPVSINVLAGQTVSIYVHGVGVNCVFGSGVDSTYNAVVSSDANLSIISGFATGGAPGSGTTYPSASSYDFGGNVNYSLSSYTYLWSDGSTSQNVTGLGLGPVSVTVTDCNGCTNTGSWFILTNYVYGCLDTLASNYDPAANTSWDQDTTGATPPCLYDGCTDPDATNYDATANNDDGSCTYSCQYYGWDDELTITFTPDWYTSENSWHVINALTGDTALSSQAYANGGAVDVQVLCANNGCYYLDGYDTFGDGWGGGILEVVDAAGNNIGSLSLGGGTTYDQSLFSVGGANCGLGCTDTAYANFDVNAVIDDGSCSDSIVGCTDPLATNYTPFSNYDDGSCCYDNTVSVTVGGGSFLSEVGWSLSLDTVVVASGGAPYAADLCLADGCYTVDMTDSWGDGWNGSTFEASSGGAVIGSGGLTSGSAGSFTFAVGSASCDVFGCTDPAADNYDPLANVDDSTCCYDNNVVVTTGIDYFGTPYNWSFNGQDWSMTLLGDTVPALVGSTIYGGTSLGDDATGCLPDGCYEFVANDASGWIGAYCWFDINGTYYSGTANGGSVTFPVSMLIPLGSATCPVLGCTDSTAGNYDPAATQDDGSCTYPCLDNEITFNMYDSWGDGWNGATYTVTDIVSGTVVATGGLATGAFELGTLCLADGCYNITVGGGTYDSEITFDFDTTLVGATAGSYDVYVGAGACPIFGCTDSTAVNYDPLADTDDGSCILACQAAPYCENFDAGPAAGWTNNGWTLDALGTTSSSTGPSDDITGGSNYMYFETSSPVAAGDQVSLSTLCLDISTLSTPTLAFYNHMYGASTGCLDVYVNGTLEWTQCGDQGNQWNFTQVDLSGYAGSTNIVIDFVGTAAADPVTGYVFWGDMAIDEVCVDDYLVISGCTDPLATNYDPMANTDDGSCNYCQDNNITVTVGGGSWQSEVGWTLTASDGTVITTGGAPYNSLLCLVDDCYTVDMTDAYGDGWNGNVFTATDDAGNVVGTGGLTAGASGSFTFSVGTGVCAVLGCTDSTATNYDPAADTDDGSCIYPCLLDAVSLNLYDSYGDGWNGGFLTVDGVDYTMATGSFISFDLCIDLATCTDIIYTAGSYSSENSWDVTDASGAVIASGPNASGDVGNCFVAVYGCTDPTALNYDASANTDDGSCIYCVYGCTDNTQFNYDPLATCDDGSCIPFQYGCTDPNAFNYNSQANSDDGSCLYLGCTDPAASNYDPNANLDDGSCQYSSTCNESPITGLFMTNIIDDRATFNFDNMNTYDASGNQICRVDQIRIQYREVGTNAWSQKNIASPTGYDATTGICNSTQKTDKNVYGLTLDTEYEWRVKIWYCSGGNGGWVDGPNFTTAPECPNGGNFYAYGVNPTKARFTWDDSNGPYEFLRIKIRVDSISNPTVSDFIQVGGVGVTYGTFQKDKNGLTPGETYRGQGRTWCDPNGGAYNSLGWGSFGVWTQPSNRIEGGESITNLDVYPNPSRDVFNVTFTSEDVQNLEVKVVNVVGEVVYTENLQQFVGEYTKLIDLANYTKGVYFLEITTDNGVVNKKLILQ